jgi:hypothetical protein
MKQTYLYLWYPLFQAQWVISSTWSSFWLTTHLLSLVDVFFNRQSAYIWAQTVLLFSPTCSFIRMRQTSYRGFSRTTKRSQPDPLISHSVESSQWENLNHLFFFVKFVFNCPSLSISRCKSRYEADLYVFVVSFVSSSMG